MEPKDKPHAHNSGENWAPSHVSSTYIEFSGFSINLQELYRFEESDVDKLCDEIEFGEHSD